MEQENAVLIVEQGEYKGKTFQLQNDKTVLGRGQAEAGKITFDNSFVSVSRNHAEISYEGGVFLLRDLGSTNGTQVNGKPLEKMADYPLKDNDIVELAKGAVVLRFRKSQKTVELGFDEVVVASQPIRVDGEAREVWVDGVKLEPTLSTRDFDLLLYLYDRQEKACSKDDLAAAWSEEFATDEQIEQCIYRIRQRVEPDPRNPRLIITIRGYGYKLTLPTQG